MISYFACHIRNVCIELLNVNQSFLTSTTAAATMYTLVTACCDTKVALCRWDTKLH